MLWMARRGRVGIHFGRESLHAVHVSTKNGELRLDWARQEKLPARLFDGAPARDIEDALSNALGRLCAEGISWKDEIHVTLSDPAVHLSVFMLDSLPGSQSVRLDICRLRFGKELGINPDSLSCTIQDYGEADGQHLLLAMAANKDWLTCLRNACLKNGLAVSGIGMSACQNFNRFYPWLTKKGGSGALLTIGIDFWSVAIWDGETRLRFVRSRWCGTDLQTEKRYEVIAESAEHTVRAYLRSSEQSILRVFVTGSVMDMQAVSDILGRRTTKECIRLPADEGIVLSDKGLREYPSESGQALAAACAD